jgi:hypothetical protein
VVFVDQYREPPGFQALVHGWCPWDLFGAGFRDPREQRVARLRRQGDTFALISQGRVVENAAKHTNAPTPAAAAAAAAAASAASSADVAAGGNALGSSGSNTPPPPPLPAGTPPQGRRRRSSSTPPAHESPSEQNLSLWLAAMRDDDEEDEEEDEDAGSAKGGAKARRRKDSAGSVGSERSGSNASHRGPVEGSRADALIALEGDDDDDDDNVGGKGGLKTAQAPIESAKAQTKKPTKGGDDGARRSNLAAPSIFGRLRVKKGKK